MLKPNKVTPKKRRERTNKPKVKTDVHELFGGDVTLYRTTNSGSVYQKGRKQSINVDKVRELRESGMGATKIASELGIGRASVYRVINLT
jgi:DNA invertase Pin-like site-specific DNA recombinase